MVLGDEDLYLAVRRQLEDVGATTYSIEDLNTIFRFPVFTRGERPIGGAGEAAKWLPLMGLFRLMTSGWAVRWH